MAGIASVPGIQCEAETKFGNILIDVVIDRHVDISPGRGAGLGEHDTNQSLARYRYLISIALGESCGIDDVFFESMGVSRDSERE
ncbi:hypothetical protein C6W88_01670 [Halomonas litopenaei]|uniref:Uncharacterized protein n=1 Tax=Halomonas litopenaei TaxID=2109328 RepID=A0ABX5IZW3_9GAMM|nr:hypothetical protein C6W89_03485 [Halomonas sp. SYSU XM8]PTL96137.1 hypothetical protein C6W88_01670 [Halomonas litopenaei]